MHFNLTPEQQSVVERAARLASDRFAPRARRYDESMRFPEEDFEDLFRAGLHAAAVPKPYGGMGYGPYQDAVFPLWMITKELAKADLSLARCWEGHVNALVLIDGMGDEAQKARWFEGVVSRGHRWVAWSGEPQARAPGQKAPFGTRTETLSDGFVVDGTKVFATSAGSVQWALLLVNADGPGGARHAGGATDGVLMLACDLSDPSVSYDDSWWDPVGMRATVSHLARFDRTFIPAENLIGRPGQYLSDGWQTCFTPHYATSFLGAAEGAYHYARGYLAAQKKASDPYVQQHIGQMAVNIETGHLWLRHVADLWENARYDEAKLAGARARHVVEHLAENTVQRCIRACGARCLNGPSPVGRILRDLTFYFRHDNDDHILATIGRGVLGEDYDGSFFNP